MLTRTIFLIWVLVLDDFVDKVEDIVTYFFMKGGWQVELSVNQDV